MLTFPILQVLSDSETLRWLNHALEKIWPICIEQIASQKILLPIIPWFLEKYKPWTAVWLYLLNCLNQALSFWLFCWFGLITWFILLFLKISWISYGTWFHYFFRVEFWGNRIKIFCEVWFWSFSRLNGSLQLLWCGHHNLLSGGFDTPFAFLTTIKYIIAEGSGSSAPLLGKKSTYAHRYESCSPVYWWWPLGMLFVFHCESIDSCPLCYWSTTVYWMQVLELGLNFLTADDMIAILAVKMRKRLGFGMWAKLHITGMHVEGKVWVWLTCNSKCDLKVFLEIERDFGQAISLCE